MESDTYEQNHKEARVHEHLVMADEVDTVEVNVDGEHDWEYDPAGEIEGRLVNNEIASNFKVSRLTTGQWPQIVL